MTHHFIHITHPGSVIAAARRLGLSSQSISRAGRAKSDKAFEQEADPQLDSILDEMEAQRSDDGEFDTFLDRIGSDMEGLLMADEEGAVDADDYGDDNSGDADDSDDADEIGDADQLHGADIDVDDGDQDLDEENPGNAAADIVESDIFIEDSLDNSEGSLPMLREGSDGHGGRVSR